MHYFLAQRQFQHAFITAQHKNLDPAASSTPARASKSLNESLGFAAQQTISRLKLWSEEHQNTRADYFAEFKNGEKSASELQKYAPFVYLEAQRRGQL